MPRHLLVLKIQPPHRLSRMLKKIPDGVTGGRLVFPFFIPSKPRFDTILEASSHLPEILSSPSHLPMRCIAFSQRFCTILKATPEGISTAVLSQNLHVSYRASRYSFQILLCAQLAFLGFVCIKRGDGVRAEQVCLLCAQILCAQKVETSPPIHTMKSTGELHPKDQLVQECCTS